MRCKWRESRMYFLQRSSISASDAICCRTYFHRPSRSEEVKPMRTDIVAGAVFPDYELTDHRGKRRKLSHLQGPDPMILVLSRGGFCPKDRRPAEALVQLHREMEVGYSRLVTISTDNMLLTNEYRDGVGAHWTFLSDPGRKVQKDLDIAEYT